MPLAVGVLQPWGIVLNPAAGAGSAVALSGRKR
jgi:hypothetical protein